MKNHKVKIYLMATILALSVSSLFGSYLLIDEILDSSISLGINQKNEKILTDYQTDLKALRRLDPQNQEAYKEKFLEVQEATYFYQKPVEIVAAVKKTYLDYFVILFAGILLLSVFAAYYLSRKVSQSYSRLLSSDLEKSRRLNELEYFETWQKIASTLAHEIKNPLTPIELMVSHLPDFAECSDPKKLQSKIDQVKIVVSEEVTRLKDMVNHFSKFSKLPDPILKNVEFVRFLQSCEQHFSASWKQLDISIHLKQCPKGISVRIDTQLFKQCLLNLTQNAIQANPKSERLSIRWELSLKEGNLLTLEVWNNGKPIDEKLRNAIFQVGFSTKNINSNQGLGLPVVRKIILEHYGDIKCNKCESGALFCLTLPIANIGEPLR